MGKARREIREQKSGFSTTSTMLILKNPVKRRMNFQNAFGIDIDGDRF